MPRLIDANKLNWDEIENEYGARTEEVVACEVLVENAPTVDAVPVVRCKDCKWWKTNYIWDGNERKICAREAYEPFRKAEDFCSRGERRENATN